MAAPLVVIGDSMSQGFQSGSISRTDLSYPAMIARCLAGVKPGSPAWLKLPPGFRVPDFRGEGGLPVNLEGMFRMLAERHGPSISLFEFPMAIASLHSYMDRVEDYWERGEGTRSTKTGPLHHNLAVWGFELDDADTLSELVCREAIPAPSDHLLPWKELPEFAMYRTACRTLNPRLTADNQALTQLAAARRIADTEGGIENLLFYLGANNCLGTMAQLEVRWSTEEDLRVLAHRRQGNLWKAEHFSLVLDRIALQIDQVGAKNVFVGTVPHVTIPPVSRGVSMTTDPAKARDADGYYEFYTNFWVWDDAFRKMPFLHRKLPRETVKLIDATIDQYNVAIRAMAAKKGWHVIDYCKLLDQLAFRRRGGQTAYDFPPALISAMKANPKTAVRFGANGKPALDTRYLRVDSSETAPEKRYSGGLFTLDGIHPTTIGYGLMAHEALKVMKEHQPAGREVAALDWDAIVASDELVANPPENLDNLQQLLSFLAVQGPLRAIVEAAALAQQQDA